jgi:hypothetical protein
MSAFEARPDMVRQRCHVIVGPNQTLRAAPAAFAHGTETGSGPRTAKKPPASALPLSVRAWAGPQLAHRPSDRRRTSTLLLHFFDFIADELQAYDLFGRDELKMRLALRQT